MRIPWKFDMPFRPPVFIATGDEDVAADDGNPFTTRRSFWKGTVWLLISLAAQTAASLMSEEVETFYSQFLFYYIVRGLAAANKFVKGIALGEIFFALIVTWFSLWSLWYLRRSWRRETRLYNVLKVFFLQILWGMGILVPLFLVLWGLNYQRAPLAETLAFDRTPTRAGELESIGLQIVSGVNSNYDLARGTSERPAPLARDAIYKVVEQAFQNETLLGAAGHGVFSDPKPLALSRLTSWAGVSGFYIPFTGEVTFNADVPAFDLPMVIAHHKAHQRGYAREDEANFIGYVVCVNSTEPYVRYSGYLYGLKVLEMLSKGNVDRYNDLLSRISEGPKADRRERTQFWERMKSSVLGAASRRIFSAYLRVNRVPGGVKNYDEDVPLIIGYYMKYPQRRLPSADQQPSADAASPLTQPEPTSTAERTPNTF
ncbi:MAG TPA: DUF3810 domain-containing protein [Blastocatellia bacterium]|jgi:hypothetical protein|nr:DUF3810 domain-containing protein [Blastocatellia bacterium]